MLYKYNRLLASIFFVCANVIASCDNERVSGSAGDGSRTDSMDRSAGIDIVDSSKITGDHLTGNKESKAVNIIRTALTEELLAKELTSLTSNDRLFIFDEIDLNADGKKEIFVGLSGTQFCGSGGCTAFLLDHAGKLITRFTVIEYPIIVQPTRSRGWHDLLAGSASAKPSLHLIRWNGKKYPGNPSLEPEFTELPSAKWTRVLNYDVRWNVF